MRSSPLQEPWNERPGGDFWLCHVKTQLAMRQKLCKPILTSPRLQQHHITTRSRGICQPSDFTGGSWGGAHSPYRAVGWPQGRVQPNATLMRATAPISFNLCRQLSHRIDLTPQGASPPWFPGIPLSSLGTPSSSPEAQRPAPRALPALPLHLVLQKLQ